MPTVIDQILVELELDPSKFDSALKKQRADLAQGARADRTPRQGDRRAGRTYLTF